MPTRKEIIEAMTSEAARIQAFMEEEPPTELADQLAQRLSRASVYLARSGKCLADAKALQNEAMVAVYEAKIDKLAKLGSTLAGKIMQAYCKDESFLVDWFDRINRGLVHSIDAGRSLLSYAKEDMRTSRFAESIRPDTYNEEYEDEA